MTGYGPTGGNFRNQGLRPVGQGEVLWRPALLRVPLLPGFDSRQETLVMMLVAGIVFLTVMDGMTLFTDCRHGGRRRCLAAGRRVDGCTHAVA